MDTTISLDDVRHIINKTTNFEIRDSKSFSTNGTISRSKNEVPILINIEENPIIYLFPRILIASVSAIYGKKVKI
jgi:hypothetical protein